MFDLIPQPDGSVAIVVNGTVKGYARDQAHAEDWKARFEQALRDLAPLVWEAGRALWRGTTPEMRAELSRRADEAARTRVAA